jgi:hypothetical protein
LKTRQKMGATCSTGAVLPRKNLFSVRKGAPAEEHGDGSPRNGHISKEMMVPHQYDTDDEGIDDMKLPKFAKDMIRKLNEEEDQIDGDLVDPILFTKIRENSITFKFVRENGTSQTFRASSLIDYMLSTQHFYDPETRIDFSDDQLKELDQLGQTLGKSSVLEAKIDGAWLKQKIEDDDDAFTGVERCAGEHIFEMLRFIETTRKSHAQEAEMELLVRVFPYFRHYVNLMFDLNRDETSLAIDQYRRFLAGPPNRPTVDRSRVLLRFCLDFLDEVMRDLWGK